MEAIDVDADANVMGDELARSLPELVAELKKLRLEMDKKSKLYEHLLGSAPGGGGGKGEDRFSERQSIFTPFAAPDERISITGGEHALRGDLPRPTAGSTRYSESFQTANGSGGRYSHPNFRHYGGAHQFQRPSQGSQRSLPRQSSASSLVGRAATGGGAWDYSVMWVSGECGISLRNFSANKVGAQIAVLQHADGVTTGMANCRLGDQLVTVNDDRVDDMRFRDIVQKLKNTSRPITLGFRTNQNVQTSPRSMGSGSSSGSFAHTAPVGRGSLRPSSFFPDDDLERPTTSSSTSSTGTLSDDVEMFCKEQEEMHSGLLVLLTETVLRCEKLQQENLDQMQNLMQLAPPSPSASTTSAVSQTPEDELTRPSTPLKRAPPPPVPTMATVQHQTENLVL